MALIGLAILSIFTSIGIPIAIVVIIIRLVSHRGGKGGLSGSVAEISPRQLALGAMALSAGLAGVGGLYVLPTWTAGLTSDGSIFAVRLVSGVVVLALGLTMLRQRLVSILMMGVGVVTILLATPYVFADFGSKGILLVIFIVLVVLVWLTVWLSKRGKTQ